MSQLTHLDSETLQNIVCRLPFQNIFRLVYMSGQKKLGRMASVLLRHVNLLNLQDVSCFVWLQKSSLGGPLAYHAVLSLRVDMPSKSQIWLRTIPDNLKRFCNTKFVLEIDKPSQLTDIDVYNVAISRGGTLEHLHSLKTVKGFKSASMVQHVEKVALSYDDWLDSLQQGLIWPNLDQLSLTVSRSTYHTYRENQAYSSKNQICPSLRRLSLKNVDCINPVQCFLELPTIANLSRLCVHFDRVSLYTHFFFKTDFTVLAQLTHLKVCCDVNNFKLDIPSLPPKLKILHLVGMKTPRFPEQHSTLQRVISGGNECIKNLDGTWWNLRHALRDKSTTLDQLVSRSTLLYNAFTKETQKKRNHVCQSLIQYLYDIERYDIAVPLFFLLGDDSYWWSGLTHDQFKQRLTHMPIERYNIQVLWQLRPHLLLFCRPQIANQHSKTFGIIHDWIRENMIAKRFDSRLLQHLLRMLHWMNKDGNQLARLAEEFQDGAVPKLEPNVAISFNIAFCDSKLKIFHFERAFAMAKNLDFAKSCCEGTVASAWFNKYPLMRNVTMVQQKIASLLNKKLEFSASQASVILHHKGGGFIIEITKRTIVCSNRFTELSITIDGLVQAKIEIEKFVTRVKNMYR